MFSSFLLLNYFSNEYLFRFSVRKFSFRDFYFRVSALERWRCIVSDLALMLRPYAFRSTSSTPPFNLRRPTSVRACACAACACGLMLNDVSHVWIHLDSPLLAGKEAKRIAVREKAAALVLISKRSDEPVNCKSPIQRYSGTDRSVTISNQSLINSEFRFYIFFYRRNFSSPI